jgi:mannose-6-phosphate isomerase-like protein (cupin superfamily)
MLRLDQVDVDMIEMALGSQDWPGGYLDPETGTVYPAFQGEVIGDDGDSIDLEEEGVDWIAIEPEGSREPYEDMVEFAEQVTDPGLRRSLDRALEGRGAFRRFRNVMYEDAPEETSRAWNDFRTSRSELRALRWLGDQKIVDAEELGERIRVVEEASVLTPLPAVAPPGTGTKVDLAEKLSQFSAHWSPKVVARLNDYEIKLVKVKGAFVWHSHADTDELFLVIEGSLTIELRDGDVRLRPGQLYVVPRGVEHRPVADGEVAAMLIEPSGVVNTGDAESGALTATHDTSLLE